MAQGTITNNTGYTLEYMLLTSTTGTGAYQSVPDGGSYTITDANNYLVLRLPQGEGFSFTEDNDHIRYDPVQYRIDENGNSILVFKYSFVDDQTTQNMMAVEGGDPEDGGSMGDPEPPIPAP